MAKELSDYRTLEELNIHDSPRFYVTNKPTVIVSVSLMMGVGCMLLPHVMAKILGLLFIVPSVYILLFVKNERLIEFYDEYLVIYKNKNSGMKIQYSFINDFTTKRSHYGTQVIFFTMNNGDCVYVETFQFKSVKNVLNKYLKNKEIRKDKTNAN